MTFDQGNKKMKSMMDMCANMSMEECQTMMKKMMGNAPDFQQMQIDLNQEIMGTPELQVLFFEWCHQIKKEIQEYANLNDGIGIDEIARHFMLSKESCEYLLYKMGD